MGRKGERSTKEKEKEKDSYEKIEERSIRLLKKDNNVRTTINSVASLEHTLEYFHRNFKFWKMFILK